MIATKSRKNSGGRLQRGIEMRSSVKMKKKKNMIRCLGTKQKKIDYILRKEPRWKNWSLQNCNIKIWFSCEKGNTSVSVFPVETGNISEKKPNEIPSGVFSIILGTHF